MELLVCQLVDHASHLLHGGELSVLDLAGARLVPR